MKSINLKTKLIGIVILIIAISVFIFLSFQKKNSTPVVVPIAITSTAPTEASLGVSVFDPIVITFNQPVDPTTINATSDPAESWTITQTAPNSIQMNHKLYLKVFTDYKLTIAQHSNTIGKLTFETAQAQNDPRYLQSLESDLNKNYPLIALTPYDTADFHVVYTAPLTLEIDLKSSITQQDAITQVKSWVSSHGADPGTHTYNVVPFSPSPAP